MWVSVSLVVGYKAQDDSRIFAEESVYLLCLGDNYQPMGERIKEIETVLKSEISVLDQFVSRNFLVDDSKIEAFAIEYGFRKISVAELSVAAKRKCFRISFFNFVFSDLGDFNRYIECDSNLLGKDIIHALII